MRGTGGAMTLRLCSQCGICLGRWGRHVAVAPGEIAQRARFHLTHVTGVDEQSRARAFPAATLVEASPGFLPRHEPEADGNARRQEKLRRHGDDAVDKVCLNDLLADV